MPAWIDHAVWWHVFPLGFVGAEAEAISSSPVAHRLAHLHAWLDYAVELGVSGLALGPIFAASTHGYDTVDHYRIDPRLGDDADFDALVQAARARGLRLLLDGVFNHVGLGHPAYREVLRRGPEADRANWFKLSWPRGTASGTEPDYACFEGHRQLVTFNHDEPELADHVTSVMRHWLSRGADGWRLDAAYAVPRHFWSSVLPRVRETHPDAYIVGEVIHGDYAGIVRDTSMDAVTQYELWKAIWSALNDRNLFELDHALERHNRFLDTFVPLTFVGNHDVTRIASRLKDDRHLPHALAILFTCGGTPSIYAGDEQALRGVKEERVGGDDAVRPTFPPTPTALAPCGWSTYRLHQCLIGLRRRYPWLHRARTQQVHLTNEQAVLTISEGSQYLLLAMNLSDDTVLLPASNASLIEAGAGELTANADGATQVRIGSHGWAVLSA
ncbi:alpha-amylase family protein [Methylobacterium sp. J-067]|uniref:alpha-amylase family protein n=1 Tax=Methylobacterium sp. J-067 TaxID=2836648 RepID=UPI001FBB7AF2|nr:alpha-amylase family protein [Methylobacterium sp. J-067]MCJ2023199.1 alpha-amylase family protein [Methylobacterium sp. J-067]